MEFDEGIRMLELGWPDDISESRTSKSETTVRAEKIVEGGTAVGLLRVADGSETFSSSSFKNKQ